MNNFVQVEQVYKEENGKVLLDEWVRKSVSDKGISIRGERNGKKIHFTRRFKKKQRRKRTKRA
jgi:hypothetical protein